MLFFFYLNTTVIQYNTIQYKMEVEYKKQNKSDRLALKIDENDTQT